MPKTPTNMYGDNTGLRVEVNRVMDIEDTWELTKVGWGPFIDDDNDGSIIWANHRGCEGSGEEPFSHSLRGGRRVSDHFPRDNALFGHCCYCGATCPEKFQVLFKLYNWEYIPDWE